MPLSDGHLGNPIVTERKEDFSQIVSAIEQGIDLTKHLSKDIRIGLQLPNQKGRRKDLDLMINDWGVHHLHISKKVMADGFVERGEPLIFACFRGEQAYLIDVMGHGDWTRDHILQVLIDEWQGENLIHEIRGAIGLQREISEDSRKVLRKNYINSSFQHNGKVYSPVGMMSTAGTSMHSRRAADQICDAIESFEEMYENRETEFRNKCAAQGFNLPDNPSFEFEIREDGCGILEVKTKSWFKLS